MREVRRLVCHGDARNRAVRSVEVSIERTAGALAVTYRLEGEIAALRVPPRGASRTGDGLWQHTCFEIFVRSNDSDRYHELNFAPSREWAAYAFARYREGEALNHAPFDPAITVRTDAQTLELDATIPLEHLLSGSHGAGALSIGLSAVVEAADGSLSYWALAHPPGKPDFHHPDAFALRLE